MFYLLILLFIGKVPALDTGSKIIVESLDICDFLEKEYPNPPLYPAEPLAVEQDKELIQKIGPLTSVFTKLILGQEKKSPEDWKNELLPHLEIFEKELQRRDTKYLGGENPGMVNISSYINFDFENGYYHYNTTVHFVSLIFNLFHQN